MSQTHCLFVVRRVHLEMYYGAMLIRIVNYGIRLNSFVAIVPATAPRNRANVRRRPHALAMLWDSSVAIDRTANIWRGVKCAFTLRRGPGRRMDPHLDGPLFDLRGAQTQAP